MKPPCSTAALLVVIAIICDVCPTSCQETTTSLPSASGRPVQPEPEQEKDREKSSLRSTPVVSRDVAPLSSTVTMTMRSAHEYTASTNSSPTTSGPDTSVTSRLDGVVLDSDLTAVHIKFNCLRPHTTCAGNASNCSADGASCHCEKGRQGYDCSLLTDSIVPTCNPQCQNGGTCSSKATNGTTKTMMCYCSEAFYGDHCEKERVYHKCNPDSVEMFVAPIVGCNDQFMGSIYVKGHEADDRCVFKASSNAAQTLPPSTFVNNINFTDCGMAENSTDVAMGMTSLSWRIVVRYDDVLLDTDQELTFTCYLRQPGNTYEWHAWMISNDNMINSQLPSHSVSSEVQPVIMSLQTPDGRPVIGPQQLGTTLHLKYTLNGGNIYDSFRIEKITASNSMTGPKRHVFSLVNNSCITADAQRIKKVVQSLERSNRTEVVLKFKVFKLKFSNQLVFENVIKACRSYVDCQPINCDQPSSRNRKKRNANETLSDRRISSSSAVDSIHHSGSGGGDAVYNKANTTLTVMYLIDESGESDTDCQKLPAPSPVSTHSAAAGYHLSNTAFIVVAILLIVAIVISVSLVVSVVYLRLLRKH